jgi:hypothetical protein
MGNGNSNSNGNAGYSGSCIVRNPGQGHLGWTLSAVTAEMIVEIIA